MVHFVLTLIAFLISGVYKKRRFIKIILADSKVDLIEARIICADSSLYSVSSIGAPMEYTGVKL